MSLAVAVMVVVTGALAQKVGNILGIGSTAVTVWEIAKWPMLLVIIRLVLATLFWASPNAKHGFQWVSPGGFIAVVLWLIASALFALYVANFGHYNKVYGSLAGVIIFLIWMWISNVAILFGAEFNAELERGRAGHPIEQEPFSELRDDASSARRKEEPAAAVITSGMKAASAVSRERTFPLWVYRLAGHPTGGGCASGPDGSG